MGLGVGKSVLDALDNQAALKLGHRTDNGEKQPPMWRTCVDGHIVDQQSDVIGFELPEQLK